MVNPALIAALMVFSEGPEITNGFLADIYKHGKDQQRVVPLYRNGTGIDPYNKICGSRPYEIYINQKDGLLHMNGKCGEMIARFEKRRYGAYFLIIYSPPDFVRKS